MKALISALGTNFFDEKPAVEIIDENLPPRTIYGFELTERFGVVSPLLKEADPTDAEIPETGISTPQSTRASKSSAIAIIRKLKPIVEPVVGNSVPVDEAAKELFESAKFLLTNHYPEIKEQNVDLLFLLFQRAGKEEKWEELSSELGDVFATRMKDKYPDLTPNSAIKGLGALDPQTMDELLFSGKHSHQNKLYCEFISNIWNEYINKFMPIKFVPDKPLCAKSGSTMCLFAFVPS